MAPENRELYSSPNVDKWLLAHQPESGRVLSDTVPICPLVEKRLTLKLAHSFVSEATDLSIRSCCA